MRAAVPIAIPLLTLALAGCGSALIPLASSLLGAPPAPRPASVPASDGLAQSAVPTVPDALSSGPLYLAEGGAMHGMRLRVFHRWDTDGDDRLSFDEYRAGVLSMLKPPPTQVEMPGIEAQIRARFAKLDTDGDGYLSESEFRLPIRGGRILRSTPSPDSLP